MAVTLRCDMLIDLVDDGPGSETPTFTRNASQATIVDHEGLLRIEARANEPRSYGARRVENLLTQSEDATHADWVKTNMR